MKLNTSLVLSLITVLACISVIKGGLNPGRQIEEDSIPLETFLIKPIDVEHLDIWVPAAKVGPMFNRSCRPRLNCSYSANMPADIRHTKQPGSQTQLARLLAEHAASFHKESLPLTIFNGWKWEYSYNLCQYVSVVYDLEENGGSWENSFEAILSITSGSADIVGMAFSPDGRFSFETVNPEQNSNIQVSTFSELGNRYGYPKK